MKRDYIITFVTEFLVLASGILVFKLAATFFGKQGFGEYALARRTISFLAPGLMLGLGVGIPRYVALARANPSNTKNPDGYFISGFILISTIIVIFILVLNFFAKDMAHLFFGSSNYANLILPLSASITGICLHSLAHCYYRGRIMMVHANILQLLNIAIIPLLVFAIPSISVSRILLIIGLAWIATSGIAVCSVLRGSKVEAWSFSRVWNKSKELLKYGLLRVPGNFAIAGLLTLPATFTAHFSGIEKAGFVAFGVSVLGLIGALFSPIGLILLPSASQYVAKNDLSSLKTHLFKLLKISVGLTVGIVLFFEIFANNIIGIYLGKGFVEAANIIRVILIGAVPYVIYAVFANALDAIYVKPLNMKNIMIALAFFVVLSILFGSFSYVIVALCAGLCILGAFTWYDVVKALKKERKFEDNGKNIENLGILQA